MGNIATLDENMINMIAAGEVIERPCNVLKELLENSIDAGATKIVVSLEDGGRKLISIVDDGCGMDKSDLVKAFEPHATSKIKETADLERISTMGFRGEALASIASVAQVAAISRTKESNEANRIEFDCGLRKEFKPCSGDYGTTVEVRNIFYKLPARRKFLRTANTEMTHIAEHFTRIALARRDLDLTLLHNGRELHRLLSGENIRSRIGKLLSRQISEDLIDAESEEKNLHIVAFIGRPGTVKSNSKYQYVFLNGRFIRDKFISHAVREAYRGLIEPNKYPVVFLFLQMPYDRYDVNVHPTKIEVRFDNPNLVHSQVLGVLREKLLSTKLDVPAKIPAAGENYTKNYSDSEHENRRARITEAMADFFKQHKPIQTQRQFNMADIHNIKTEYPPDNTPTESIPRIFMQVHDSYIVAQSEEGFIIIDQHALHERIMYENLCRRLTQTEEKLASQRLLIPQTLELTNVQLDAVKDNSELLTRLGIELEPFGPKTVAIQAFPAILNKITPAEFVQDLLDLLTDKAASLDEERLLHEVLDMTACKAAIKAGQKLNDKEIEQLLADREVVERASRCPHGRPTTIEFSITELEKQFKRT